jgi:Family of unknown function (DUF6653)
VSTSAVPPPETTKITSDANLARLFGLQGDSWLRHANPISVWTRFAVLPLLAVSIWSRAWIGWWSLIPIALSLIFMVVNPLLFPKPRSTKNWASKGVLGERIWADRTKVELPQQFRRHESRTSRIWSNSWGWWRLPTGWSSWSWWPSPPAW